MQHTSTPIIIRARFSAMLACSVFAACALLVGCQESTPPTTTGGVTIGSDRPVTTARLSGARLTDIREPLSWTFNESTVIIENKDQPIPSDVVDALLGDSSPPVRIEAAWRLDEDAGTLRLTDIKADKERIDREVTIQIAPAGFVRVNLGARQYNERPNIVDVKSSEEFINAIGPNRTIRLAPGDYILRDVKDRWMYNIRWDREHDGKTITVRSVKNLKIIGKVGEITQLLVRPRYIYVLNFEDCENIHIENLIMGHSPNAGSCMSGVLGAANCTRITLSNCDLFGCGTEGLTLRNVKDMEFYKSTIRDCTYGIMTIEGCDNIYFAQSSFIRNKEFWGVNVQDSKNILFSSCNFEKNHADGESLFDASSSSNIQLKKCTFVDNNVESLSSSTSVKIDSI